MRMTAIASDKVNCLSIRMDEVPGLDTSLVAEVHCTSRIGIRNNRQYVLASVPKHGSKVPKVPMMYLGSLRLQFATWVWSDCH